MLSSWLPNGLDAPVLHVGGLLMLAETVKDALSDAAELAALSPTVDVAVADSSSSNR